MKKLFVLLLTILLLSSFFPLGSGKVLAVNVVSNVEYALPYPGILPDNPLYFLKVLRDKLITWTIREPDQKAFYLLLLADKRLAAGEKLINSGKEDIGANTLVQAENYFAQAVDIAWGLPKEKRTDLVAKLVLAGAKHNQVIGNLSGKITAVGQKAWQTSVDNNTKLQSRVMELYLQK